MDLNYLLNNFNSLSLKNKEHLTKRINWKQIVPNLKLNEGVLETFADQLDWNDVVRHQYISEEFYARHKHRLDK